MDIELAFGRTLKTLRERENISQEKLAEKSNLHRTYISLLERGNRQPTITVLFKLANALNVTPSEIIYEIEKMILINENS